MSVLETLSAHDLAGSVVTLWVFKKSQHAATEPPTFSGRWIETTPDLDAAFKTTLSDALARIEDERPYGFLSEIGPSSAMTISVDETHFGLLLEACSDEVVARRALNLRNITNTAFYVIKCVSHDGILYAVKKADSSWKTKRAMLTIQTVFDGERLTVRSESGFDIAKSVDFFVIQGEILVINKANFESILSYKEAHKEDFSHLLAEREFANTFTTLSHIQAYVSENKIHLRRASAIRQKGYYRNQEFMENLRLHHQAYGLNLVFDDQGRIVPSEECCRDIFQALLDFRLASPFSQLVYDVQDTSPVNIQG